MAVAGMVTRLMDEPIPIRRSYIVKSYCVHKMKKVRRDIHSFEIDKSLIDQIIKTLRFT